MRKPSTDKEIIQIHAAMVVLKEQFKEVLDSQLETMESVKEIAHLMRKMVSGSLQFHKELEQISQHHKLEEKIVEQVITTLEKKLKESIVSAINEIICEKDELSPKNSCMEGDKAEQATGYKAIDEIMAKYRNRIGE